MLNISKMPPKDRCSATTLFINNVGRIIQARISAPAGLKGDKIEGILEGYQDEHLIVMVKHGSSKKSTKRILWPFVMLDEIHFPNTVT